MKTTFYVFLCIILLLFMNFSGASVVINEVMYDAIDNTEWIELYNPDNETINLAGGTLTDNKNTDELVCCGFAQNCSLLLKNNSYAIITDQDTTLYDNFEIGTETLQICVDDNSLGNGLGNVEDIITISNGTFETTFEYNYNMGADGNNKTLERNKLGEWKESIINGGTPGMKNSVYDFSYDYSALTITEVMVDPFGDDDARKPLGEWVELYNSGDEPVYIKDLVLYDEDDDNELYLTKTNTKTLELCSGCYTVVYRDTDGDFDLSKIEDTVRLYTGYPISENVLLDKISFTNAMEGASFSKFDGGWYTTVPTPGDKNVYTAGCDWHIDIEMNNSIFHTTDMDFTLIVGRTLGEKQNITVRGTIEDIFGEPVKEYSPWTNQEITTQNKKTYSPNLKEGVYQIHFWIDGIMCDDIDITNNNITKLVAINPQYKKSESSVDIEKMYLGNDNKAEWGDQFTASIVVYKGNETRYSVQVWAEMNGEKVSKTTKLSIHDQYKQYPLTIPIQLEPNCNNNVDDGNALLVVDAFGLRTEKEFIVQGVDDEVCKDYLDYVQEQDIEIEKKKEGYRVIEKPGSVFPGEIFPIQVQLLNGNDIQPYTIWSYVYRGSKCYSCDGSERDENTQRVILNPDEVRIVDFILKIDDDIQEGDYNLKVKIQKGTQKTVREITETITVVPEKQTLSKSLPFFSEFGESNESTVFSSKTHVFGTPLTGGVVVYESSSVKAKKLIPILLFVTFGLVCLVLIWKK